MKKLLTICVSFILLFGFGSVAFGVFGDSFISIQLGNTPVANNILTTDGTDNIWSDGITLDTVTSTNLFFSNATGTNSLYVGDGTNGWKMGNKSAFGGAVTLSTLSGVSSVLGTPLNYGIIENGIGIDDTDGGDPIIAFVNSATLGGSQMKYIISTDILSFSAAAEYTFDNNLNITGYATTSAGLYTQGNIHSGSNIDTDGNLSVNGNATTSGSTYLGTSVGLSTEYINQWSDLSSYLSLSDYFTLNSWYATTTDGLGEGIINLYDKTVSLTEGSNIIITGTYPNYTIATLGGGVSGGIATSSPWIAGEVVVVHNDAAIESVATSSLGLPTFSTLDDYLTLTNYYATTTDGLGEGVLNLYWTQNRWETAYNATTTLNGLTIADYLSITDFSTYFDTNYNATTTLNGLTIADYLAIADFSTYFDIDYNATTTLNGFTNNQTNWNTAYDERGSVIAGLHLTWDGSELDVDDNLSDYTNDLGWTTFATTSVEYWESTKWRWATSSEQYFWNNTSTWAYYDTNWDRNYNATTTLNGLTIADYLAITDFSTYFDIDYNATTTLNGLTIADYLAIADFSTYFNASYNGTTTLNGLTIADYLAITDFATYFDTNYNATTTLNGLTNNQTEWNTAYDERGSQIDGTHLTWDGSELDVDDNLSDYTNDLGWTTWATSSAQNFWNVTSTWAGFSDEFNKYGNASTTIGNKTYSDLEGSPSDVITAGDNLSWSGDTLNAAESGLNNWVFGGSDFITPSTTVGIIVNASSTFTGDLIVGNETDVLKVTDGLVGPITSPVKNYTLIWNGTAPVWAAQGTSFTFSIINLVDDQTGTQEIGTGEFLAIGDITFSATYSNGPATSGSVQIVSGATAWTSALDLTGGSYEGPTASTEAVDYPAAPGTTIRFRLSASDGTDSDTDDTTIVLNNYRFWGVTSKTDTFTEADVEGLAGSELSNSKSKSFTVTPGASDYIIWASRKSLGTVTFTVGGFEGGFEAPETLSITNSKGFTEDYYVYRSTNVNLGETTVVTN